MMDNTLPADETLRLATFLSNLTYEDLPPDVIQQAKSSILNILGCALGSAHDEPCEKAVAALLPLDPREDASSRVATIWGRRERTNLQNAAILNGISATTADYDDTHLRTVVHPSRTSIAAVLPWAETHHLSGKELILAFVVAVEAQCAVALAISPSSYNNGWHITGLTGSFSAAAGIAKLLHLQPAQFAAALGHASSMASGTRAMFGTDTKTLHVGQHAQNGILAAKLAGAGFGSCPRAIEAWAKLVSTTIDNGQIAALARGGRWQILENAFKPYPCGIVIHPLIDACLEISDSFSSNNAISQGPKNVDDIAEIEVNANPLLTRLCNVRHPQTGLETIFSLYHGCAVALIHGRAGRNEFSEAMAAHDPQVRRMRDRIVVHANPEIRDDEAILTFKSRASQGGESSAKTVHVQHAKGSVENLLSKDFLELKFVDQAVHCIGKDCAEVVIKSCWNLDGVEDVADLARLLAPA